MTQPAKTVQGARPPRGIAVKRSSIARRYAKALFELALESNRVEEVGSQLQSLLSAFESSEESRAVMMAPVLTGDERVKLVEALLAALPLDPIVANALRLLAERSRLADLPDIVGGYTDLADRHVGRVRAQVTTAIAISEEQVQQIAQSLSGATDRKVTVERKVDPTILGGVVAQIGSIVYDGSLRTQLEEMKKQLKSA